MGQSAKGQGCQGKISQVTSDLIYLLITLCSSSQLLKKETAVVPLP